MMRALTLFLVVINAAPALATQKVAVLPLNLTEGIKQHEVDLVTDLITQEAGKRKDLSVIGAAELRSMVTLEQTKTLLGCTDDSCLAEVGAALGVDAVINGTLYKLDTKVILTLTLMDAHKSVVLGRRTEKAPSVGALVEQLPAAVVALLQAIPGGPPVAASSTTPAAASASPTSPTGTAVAENPAPTSAAKEDGGGGSSMPRRIAGIAVAGVGGVLFLAALVIGGASLGWLIAGRLAVPALTTGYPKYVGTGVAGVADVLGILSVVVVGVGIVIAAIP